MEDSRKRPVNFRIDVGLLEWAKDYAALTQRTLTQLVVDLLVDLKKRSQQDDDVEQY